MPGQSDLGAQIAGIVGSFIENDVVQLILRSIAAGVVVLWIAAVWWGYRDGALRTGSTLGGAAVATAVLLGTPLLFPFMALSWMLVRPSESLADRAERDLTMRALEGAAARERCQACGQVVDGGWRRCPSCGTWLLEPCARCGRDVQAAWSICPWCAFEGPAAGPPDGRPRWVAVGPGLPAAYQGDVPVTVLQGRDAPGPSGPQGLHGMIPVAARTSATPRAMRTSRGR